MPNIMICGFTPKRAEGLRTSIEIIMRNMSLGDEALTSIVDMEAKSCDGTRTPMPYLRICSTDEDEIQKIINTFKEEGIKVDVEWLVLNGFILANEMT